jgi:hypothetical protein
LGDLGWYITVRDPYGAEYRSGVSTFRAVAAAVDPTIPAAPGGTPIDPGTPSQPGAPGTGTAPAATEPAASRPSATSGGRLAATGGDTDVAFGLWMALVLVLAGGLGVGAAARRRVRAR